MTETICAIASSVGKGSISIVRVSGDNAYDIALALSSKTNLVPRMATLSKIYDTQGLLIDEALLIYFQAPLSFTGEDIVEFQCHGGIVVVNTILSAILKTKKARLAEPGEFSKRAFLNGKMDLSKAEAISKLIEIKSKDALHLLSRHLKGDLQTFCDELRLELITVLAFIEVSIDYAEEDLPQNTLDQIYKKLDFCISKLKNILEISNQRAGLLKGFSISIIGKPNVGKSSLLNKLLSYNRAIVSDIEGTTRDTIEEEIFIGSHLVKIIDTAGIRDASDDIEMQGITRSKEAISHSDIVIALFDSSKPLDINDKNILSLIDEYKKTKKIFVYINKQDLENKLDISGIDTYQHISTKENIDIVIENLKKYLDTKDTDELLLTSSRQIELVSTALSSLQEADISELELFAFNINEAIKQIAYITKSYETSDVLDVMFGSFCLGK